MAVSSCNAGFVWICGWGSLGGGCGGAGDGRLLLPPPSPPLLSFGTKVVFCLTIKYQCNLIQANTQEMNGLISGRFIEVTSSSILPTRDDIIIEFSAQV